MTIVWTEYMRYHAQLRGFDLSRVEHIVKYSQERYLDTATGRSVAVGRHGSYLVMVPFEQAGEMVTPVTVHSTTPQQISLRLKSGRFTYE